MAQKTESPIIPAVVKFEKFIRLNTWDGLVIPYPFTRGEVIVGEEFRVGKTEDLERARKRLESVLNNLSSDA